MRYWRVVKRTATKFAGDSPMNYSSSIAFYVVFSMPAILIITIWIAGSAYEDQVVRESLLEQIRLLFGPNSALTVDRVMTNAHLTGSSLMAKVVGIATLIFSATTVFVALQTSLNHIWGIRAKPGRDLQKFLFDRLLSLALVISIGFLLLVSLVLDALVTIFNDALASWFSAESFLLITVLNVVISLLIITLVFAVIFKVLPDATIRWKDVWVGAFVTTLLFSAGKYLIGFYLGSSSLSDFYGAAGSLVLLLVWVYYSAVIVLFGAEFTFVYSQELGDKIRPTKYAVAVHEEEEGGAPVVNEEGPDEDEESGYAG